MSWRVNEEPSPEFLAQLYDECEEESEGDESDDDQSDDEVNLQNDLSISHFYIT